jgi:hypothetical protein
MQGQIFQAASYTYVDIRRDVTIYYFAKNDIKIEKLPMILGNGTYCFIRGLQRLG